MRVGDTVFLFGRVYVLSYNAIYDGGKCVKSGYSDSPLFGSLSFKVFKRDFLGMFDLLIISVLK